MFESSMDYNVMAIIAIIASVGLLTVTIAAALPTMIAFAKGDHSRSLTNNDRVRKGRQLF